MDDVHMDEVGDVEADSEVESDEEWSDCMEWKLSMLKILALSRKADVERKRRRQKRLAVALVLAQIRQRKRNMPRQPMVWEERTDSLGEMEFRKTYRMSKESFSRK